MEISQHTQAVLLLTAWLGKPGPGQPQPLGNAEWARFAAWLHEQHGAPADLLNGTQVLEGWNDPKAPADRLRRLLERSAALAISLERWQRAGLWVVSRSDEHYPRRLKKHLRHGAPPILFGAGDPALLEAGGIAVVGARDANEEELDFTRRLGAQAAAQARNLVSGGARGVDEASMLGALEAEGTAVGVLADSLLRASSSSRYRRFLMDGNLALVSPFNPEAGFRPANAMARNKYIYCLADAAVVVASAKGRGGTWAGATENMRKGWVPLWVRPSPHHAGNAALIQQGAHELPALEALEMANLAGVGATTAAQPTESLFDAAAAVRESEPVSGYEAAPEQAPPPVQAESAPAPQPEVHDEPDAGDPPPALEMDFYALFLHRFRQESAAGPLTVEDMQQRFDLHKSQLADWLKRAVEDGHVEKLTRPVRYTATGATQPPLGF